MRKFLILLLVVLAAAGLSVFLARQTNTPAPAEITTAPTDFVKAGFITVNNPGQAQGVLYLVYEEPGTPALSKQLELDGLSVCATNSGALPCMAMSVSFDVAFALKRAIVEGVEKDSVVLVRKLYRLEEGQPELAPGPGRIFILWTEAVSFIQNCQVEMVTQTHSLDVNLDLSNGQRVVSVEPVIDEVFNVIQKSQPKCGSFPIATE